MSKPMQRLQAYKFELIATQARFACVECGFEENADVVGAINVLREGHARLACEVSENAE